MDDHNSPSITPQPQPDPKELVAESVPVTQNALPRPTFARSVFIIVTCTTVMIFSASNATSMSMSLSTLQRSIDIDQVQLQWLISSYTLSSGCLLLSFGRLADLCGRKKVFLIGMSLQTIFTLGVAYSKNGITLNIVRALQGMASALAFPATLGALGNSFSSPRARSIAFATFAAGAPLGSALGSIIGGILVQFSSVHWRAPLFLFAGIAALCVVGGLISFYPDGLPSGIDTRVDWIGAILVTGGLVLIMLVLGQAPSAGWRTPYIISCLVIGITLICVFVMWQHYLEKIVVRVDRPKSFWTPPPLVKLSLWTLAGGRMAIILVIGFLNWSGFVSWIYWVQLFYQNYLGLTPVLAMLRLIPMAVTGCLCNVLFALAVSRVPIVVFVVFGSVATGFASVLFALGNPSATYWAFEFPSTVLVVFGADFVYSASTLYISNTVSPHEQSLAGGLFQTMTGIGTAFGLAMSTIVFNNVVNAQSTKLGAVIDATGRNAPMVAILQAYRSALWTCAGFSFFTALLAIVFLQRIGIIEGRQHAAQQPSTHKNADTHPQSPISD